MEKIAFLGLGAMGSRMVPHLVKAGYRVAVWNRSEPPPAAFAAGGAELAPTPKAAAENAAFVITMLRDDAAAAEVWLDPARGAVAGLAPGAMAIECSTVTPRWVERLGAAAAARRARALDAPVAGSLPQAAAGQLIFLVGGSVEDFAAARPVLEPMAAAVHHVGPSGHGMRMKLAVNTMLGVQVAAMGEVLGVLAKGGIEPARAVELLAGLPVASPAAAAYARLMAAHDYTPRFPNELMAKDFGCVLAAAAEAGIDPPMARAALEVYEAATRAGLGKDNLSALVRLYE